MSGAAPVAATRGRATLSIAVSRVESSVISWGGKGDGGKGSNDDNEELHSVKKIKKSASNKKCQRRTRPTRKLRWKVLLDFSKVDVLEGLLNERKLVQR